MTEFGWDASDFDWPRGSMDYAAAARDGIVFTTHKATEGTSTQHRNYGSALARARAAGIPVLGAYHVVRDGPSISDQVHYLLNYVNSQTPWWSSWPHWFFQVDCERWPYDNVGAQRGHDFSAALSQSTGRRVVLYASRGQYAQSIPSGFPLWNAAYPSSRAAHYRDLYPGDNGEGWTPYSGQTAKLWQYSANATIGSQRGCDVNAWRGGLPDLLRWVNPAVPTPPTPTPPSPSGHKPGSRELYETNPQMSGQDVKFVQQFIGPLHCGPADGYFGDHTKTGVIWYQGMRGIGRDGHVGPQTWGQMGVKWTG